MMKHFGAEPKNPGQYECVATEIRLMMDIQTLLKENDEPWHAIIELVHKTLENPQTPGTT